MKAYHFLGAAACGLLTAAAFAGLEAMFLAWISLIPLFFLLSGKKPGQAFLLGGTAGLFYHGFLPFWIPNFVLPVVLSVLAWAVFGLVFSLLERRRPLPAYLAAPFLWAALEFGLALGLQGRAWGVLGLSQTRNLLFIQMAGITGAYGISFILVLFQAFFVGALKTGIRVLFVAGMVILVLVHVGGFLSLKTPSGTERSFEAAAFREALSFPSQAGPGLGRFGDSTFGALAGSEIAAPELVRKLVGGGASFLAVVGEETGRRSRIADSRSLSQAVLRAVENRRFVLLAEGGSDAGIVDPFGRVAGTTRITPGRNLTFYARNGEVFALFCLTIQAMFLILSFFKRRP